MKHLYVVSSIILFFIIFPSSAQNVGIGTSTPGEKLDVLGTIQFGNGARKGRLYALSSGLTPNPGGSAFGAIIESSYQGHLILDLLNNDGGDAIAFRYSSANDPDNVNTVGFVMKATGNVGIGNASPSQKLDLSGWIELGNESTGGAGTAGAMRYHSAGKIQYHDGTAWRDLYSSSTYGGDNLGNHTATTNLNMSDYQVQNIRALQGKDWDDNTGGTDNKYRVLYRDGAHMFYDGGLVVGQYGNGTWSDVANGNIIAQSNIGINVTSPSARLDVGGNAEINGDLNMTVHRVYEVTYLDMDAGNGKGVRFWNGSDNYKIHMGNAAENMYGPVQDYSIKMNMNNDSNRGWTWGATGLTPTAALSVGGHFQVSNRLIAPIFYDLDNTGYYSNPASTSVYNDLQVRGSDLYDNSGHLRLWGEDNVYIGMDYNNDDANNRAIIFGKNNAAGSNITTANEIMRIHETGNVAIGTTSPAHRFHVYRNTNPGAGNTVILGQSAGASGVGTAGSITNTSNTYGAVEGNTTAPNGTGVKGLHLASSGYGYGVYGSTNAPGYGWGGYFIGDVYCSRYYYGSDERFKKDIETLEEYSVLEKLMELEPKVYEYNTEEYPGLGIEPGSKNFGFIAQDLAQLFPEVVTNDKAMDDPTRMPSALGEAEPVTGYYLVDYVSMVPLLVQGMQEQQEIIDEQKELIDDLVDRIADLENQ